MPNNSQKICKMFQNSTKFQIISRISKELKTSKSQSRGLKGK